MLEAGVETAAEKTAKAKNQQTKVVESTTEAAVEVVEAVTRKR